MFFAASFWQKASNSQTIEAGKAEGCELLNVQFGQKSSHVTEYNGKDSDELNVLTQGVPPSALDSTLIPLSALDTTLIPPSALDTTLVPPSALDSTLVPLSALDSTLVPPSALDTALVPPSALGSTLVPPSALDTALVPPSALDTTQLPPSALDTTQLPQSTLDTTLVPPSAFDTTLPLSALDTTLVPPSALDSTLVPPSALDTTLPLSALDTTLVLPSALDTTLNFGKQYLSIVASHKHRSVSETLQFLPHLPFITPVEVFQVTSAGGVYKDDSLGISITVPEGAVPEFIIFPIEIGTCLYGPFQFPQGSSLIAPILMLCPQKNIPLKKPIIVTLPHILTEATEGDIECLNIRVVKADHATFRGSGLEKCVLEDIDPCESHASFDDQNSITFSVSHFCFLSVRAKNAKKKNCCIFPLIPIDRSTGVFTFRLCVTYFMKPCIQVRCMFISMSRVNVQYLQAIKEEFLKERYEPKERYELKDRYECDLSSIIRFSFESEDSFIEASIKCVDQNKWSVTLNSADSDSGIQVSIHYECVILCLTFFYFA